MKLKPSVDGSEVESGLALKPFSAVAQSGDVNAQSIGAVLQMEAFLCQGACEDGLVLRAFVDDILGFAPALNYTEADVDTLIDKLHRAIAHACKEAF